VLQRRVSSPSRTGGVPTLGQPKQQHAIPFYTGHISGKVAENVHGGTFRAENERSTRTLPIRDMRRTLSAPEQLNARETDGKSDAKGLRVPPRMPGYGGTIPGKLSETVHGMRFSEASEKAAALRHNNPFNSSDGWLKAGRWPADRRATYKFYFRSLQADMQSFFTEAEEKDMARSNLRLGQTFGLQPPRSNFYRPGDRYLHTLSAKPTTRLDPTTTKAAGQPSCSAKLDQQRWQYHNAVVLKNGKF